MAIVITLPEDIECQLKSGQRVHFNTPFLENKIVTDISIPIAVKLGVKSDKIFNHLKKFVGDPIEKNDVLAEKKGVFGKHKIYSEFKGKVKEINHVSGEIVISTFRSQEGNIKAWFIGEVEEIDKKNLKLKVEEAHEFSLKYSSGDFGGEAFYLKDIDKPFSEEQMDDKVTVTETVTPYLISKSEALGTKGFITVKSFSSETDLYQAQLKNTEDLKKVFNLNLPYCLINKQYSKIYFYK